jgi:hypothetical protein
MYSIGSDPLTSAYSPPTVPGSDVLSEPIGSSSSAGPSSTTSSTTAPATTATAPTDTYAPADPALAGSDILSKPIGYQSPTAAAASSSSSSNTAPAAQDPYQAALSQIQVWSASYLMQSLGSSVPSASSGSPSNFLSGDSSIFSALQSGLDQGSFGGTGVDNSA